MIKYDKNMIKYDKNDVFYIDLYIKYDKIW